MKGQTRRVCLGWMLICVLVGDIGTCLAAQSDTHFVERNKTELGDGFLHIIPLQAELLRLNATLGAFTHASGNRADTLLQKAAHDAWNAVQLTMKPLDMPATSVSRRKLYQSNDNTSLASLMTPELSDLIKARLRTAAQTALQLQQRQQQPSSGGSSSPFSTELSNFLSNDVRSYLNNSYASLAQQPQESMLSQLLPDLSLIPGMTNTVKGLAGVSQQVEQYRSDVHTRVRSFANTVKALTQVDQLFNNMFSMAKNNIKPAQTPTKQNGDTVLVRSRRLHQATSSSAAASATSPGSNMSTPASMALEQLVNATLNDLSGPAASTDMASLVSSSSTSSSLTSGSLTSSSSVASSRRLQSSDDTAKDQALASEQLQTQIYDVLDALNQLQAGSVTQNVGVRRRLMAHARGLESRFRTLQSESREQRRRLMEQDHVFVNPTLVGGGGMGSSNEGGKTLSSGGRLYNETRSERPQNNTDDIWDEDFDIIEGSTSAYLGQPTSITNTVIVMLPPANSSASTAMVGDMLDLVRELVQSAFVPLPAMPFKPTFLPGLDSSNDYSNVEGIFGPASEAEDDNDLSLDVDFAAPTMEEFATHRRRALLSHSENSAKPQYFAAGDYDYDIDAAYAEDDAWLWEIEEQDVPPAGLLDNRSKLEEALLGFQSGPEGILELVVSMNAPVEEGGIPPALLHLLADPYESSLAELLELLSSPGYGGATMRIDPNTAIDAKVPRFAVFGPASVNADSDYIASSASSAMGAMTARERLKKERMDTRISDLIVVPLGSAAKAPIPHSHTDSPTGMDARWWGVVLSLGALGLLLVGVSLAALKLSPTAGRDLTGDDSVHHGGRGSGGGQTATLRDHQDMSAHEPLSPWESKVQNKDLMKAKVEKTPRKTSNLPA